MYRFWRMKADDGFNMTIKSSGLYSFTADPFIKIVQEMALPNFIGVGALVVAQFRAIASNTRSVQLESQQQHNFIYQLYI